MSALVLLGITARRILGAGRGLPWILWIAASALLARSNSAVDPGATASLRAGTHLLMATAAAFGVALFAPLAILGLSHGKPTDLLLASRPLGAAARGAGIAAGAAAAAAVVFLGFLAALPLAGGAIGGELRPRMLVLPARSDELRAAGSSVDFELDAPAGALSLVLAPRIGFAWGYGDPNPVRLEARVTQEDVVITTPLTLRGRERAALAIARPGRVALRITKVGEGPLVRFPEGSLVIAGAPMGTLTAGLALLARIACVLWLCACAAAAFSLLLDRPVAAFASAAFAVVVLAAGLPAIRDALGVGSILPVGDLLDGWMPPFPAAAALRCLAGSALFLVFAAAIRRRRI
jgi:hypothetical protein